MVTEGKDTMGKRKQKYTESSFKSTAREKFSSWQQIENRQKSKVIKTWYFLNKELERTAIYTLPASV